MWMWMKYRSVLWESRHWRWLTCASGGGTGSVIDARLPQFASVEIGDIEAPNDAKRKAKWPPQGQAAEHEPGPEWSPRRGAARAQPEGLGRYGHLQAQAELATLKGTGTCKPEGGSTDLKNILPVLGRMRWWLGPEWWQRTSAV